MAAGTECVRFLLKRSFVAAKNPALRRSVDAARPPMPSQSLKATAIARQRRPINGF
jgi:hypothetical protein